MELGSTTAWFCCREGSQAPRLTAQLCPTPHVNTELSLHLWSQASAYVLTRKNLTTGSSCPILHKLQGWTLNLHLIDWEQNKTSFTFHSTSPNNLSCLRAYKTSCLETFNEVLDLLCLYKQQTSLITHYLHKAPWIKALQRPPHPSPALLPWDPCHLSRWYFPLHIPYLAAPSRTSRCLLIPSDFLADQHCTRQHSKCLRNSCAQCAVHKCLCI